MRQEQIYLERYMETVNLINSNDLGTAESVQEFISGKEAEMAMLLSARNKIDNRRRATTDVEKDECSRKRKAISAELKTIRHDINLAKGPDDRQPKRKAPHRDGARTRNVPERNGGENPT